VSPTQKEVIADLVSGILIEFVFQPAARHKTNHCTRGISEPSAQFRTVEVPPLEKDQRQFEDMGLA